MPGDRGVCGEAAIDEMEEAENDRLGIEFIESGRGAT
jgi:hypothetical protein